VRKGPTNIVDGGSHHGRELRGPPLLKEEDDERRMPRPPALTPLPVAVWMKDNEATPASLNPATS
jgi:hypothetical protein